MEIDEIYKLGNSIKLNPVLSSNIKGIGYEPNLQYMSVLFNGGSKYLYLNVEPEIYSAITNSDSIGKTLNECVVRQKDKYKYYKLN